MFNHTVKETATASDMTLAIKANIADAQHANQSSLEIPAWGWNGAPIDFTRVFYTGNTHLKLEETTLRIVTTDENKGFAWVHTSHDGEVLHSGIVNTETPKAAFVEMVSAFGAGYILMIV